MLAILKQYDEETIQSVVKFAIQNKELPSDKFENIKKATSVAGKKSAQHYLLLIRSIFNALRYSDFQTVDLLVQLLPSESLADRIQMQRRIKYLRTLSNSNIPGQSLLSKSIDDLSAETADSKSIDDILAESTEIQKTMFEYVSHQETSTKYGVLKTFINHVSFISSVESGYQEFLTLILDELDNPEHVVQKTALSAIASALFAVRVDNAKALESINLEHIHPRVAQFLSSDDAQILNDVLSILDSVAQVQGEQIVPYIPQILQLAESFEDDDTVVLNILSVFKALLQKDIDEPNINEYLVSLLSSDNVNILWYAVELAGYLKDSRIKPSLIELLDDTRY